MAPHEGVLVSIRNVFLALKPFESLQHATARLLRQIEVLQAALISGRFLRAAFGQHRPQHEIVAGGNSGAGAGRYGRSNPKYAHKQEFGLVSLDARAQGREVATGDMSGFMGNDTDDLIGRITLHNRAGVDVNVSAIDDEGIENPTSDYSDRHASAAKPRRLEDRPGIVTQKAFYLSIANERQRLGLSSL
ncbi:MAG: hypothetical protein OEM91_14035 [Hyphomicrobiales bacterium]|nr:hypothetical protein [Hyphomicrobiales bacterium]